MAKVETAKAETLSRPWIPPLNWGLFLMIVLIGSMGFYMPIRNENMVKRVEWITASPLILMKQKG